MGKKVHKCLSDYSGVRCYQRKAAERIIKLFTGAIITFIFVWMSFTTYRATEVIYTSELYPYTAVEAKDDLVIYVDKDITLTSLWGRASDGNKVNFYDVVILPVGKHTITIDARTLSGNVKSALISKDLIIHDGVNLKILSNDKGIDCKGELTIGKIKSDTVSTVSPSICHEVMGSDAMIFVF